MKCPVKWAMTHRCGLPLSEIVSDYYTNGAGGRP